MRNLMPALCTGHYEQLLEMSGWPSGLRRQIEALLPCLEQSLALSETQSKFADRPANKLCIKSCINIYKFSIYTVDSILCKLLK